MNVVVIGNGGFAVRCLKLMRDTHNLTISLVVADPRAQVLHGVLESYCERNNVALLHTSKVNESLNVDKIRAANPDFMFSVYNMQLLRPEVLSIPKRWAINFHNGPLPRYRGVNVYSWAILNGETEYGITWHEMVPGIDAGAIMSQKMFPITTSDTPTTLMSKGFDAGVDALDNLLGAIKNETLKVWPQDESGASYFSKKERPNDGYVNLSWRYERIERFIRALDFRPLPNTFVHPTLSYAGQKFYVQSVRSLERSCKYPNGYVFKVEGALLHVQISDAVVEFGDFLDAEFRPVEAQDLAARSGLKVASVLDLHAHRADFY